MIQAIGVFSDWFALTSNLILKKDIVSRLFLCGQKKHAL